MNLWNPWELLWLAPVAGGIVALWMLRRKRQEVTVSSLILWQALLQDTQANAPFQKLRRNLLLFLQLLLAFLLIFALARPYVYGHGLTGRTFVVILDTSASMAATDVRPTRLDAAKAAAKEFLRHEMNGTDVATVITAGTRPETRLALTENQPHLDDAIDQVTGTDAPGDLPAALTLALSLTGGKSAAQIRVFTDGAVTTDDAAKIAALPFAGTQVSQEIVGTQSADNLALTALDGRRNPATGQMEVFAQIRHFGSRPPSGGTLSLLQDGKLIDARAIAPGSDGTQSETFDSPLLASGGIITARLDDIHDDLTTDNQASIVLSPPVKKRVLLVSRGNLFLEQGLNLDPDVTLEECSPDQFATEGKHGAGYALVVFDDALPAGPLPPVNILVFHAGNRQTPLMPTGGTTSAPAFVDQNRIQPVMRFVDLDGVHLRTALKMSVAPGATTLADGTGGPWIAAQENGPRRLISVAFDLSDSDWPLRVSFPIFLSNAVDWLTAGARPGATAPQTQAGQPLSVLLPPGTTTVDVERPDGHHSALAAPAGGGLVVDTNTSRVGLYHVRAAGADYPAAVDLLDATASDLTPRPQPSLIHAGVTPRLADVPLAHRARSDLWAVVAAVVLVGLLLEWFVYHRRIG
jgi:Ca-activated chloride channel family protein